MEDNSRTITMREYLTDFYNSKKVKKSIKK